MSGNSLPLDLAKLTPLELLRIHSTIGDELKTRGITRSANNPVGDLAETIFCEAFGWKIAPPSMPASDAIGPDRTRYQIKSRRLIDANGSRQLGAIRNLNQDGFDVLAAVLFSKDYGILKAALIPLHIVKSESRHQEHTNSALFMLRDGVWNIAGVLDVTKELRSFVASWGNSGT